MKIKYSYIIPAIILVVFVSGCAQATSVMDSLKKVEQLKASTGYSIDYNMTFKYDLSEKTKAGLAKNPSSAGGLGALGSIPTISLKQSVAQKGKNIKSSLDFSGLAALSQQTRTLPFQKISTYVSENNLALCIHSSSEVKCTQDSIDGLSKKSPELAAQLEQYKQFSEMTPENVLAKFKTLYDKGAVTLGATGTENVTGRACDKISYTIILSKLGPMDLIALMGPSGNQITGGGASQEQLAEAGQFLQTMIKGVSQELCLDKQYGVVLSSTSSTSVDMTELMKGVASAAGSQGSGQIPDELAFTIKTGLNATSFNPSAKDSEFSPPAGAKMLTPEEFNKLSGSEKTTGGLEETGSSSDWTVVPQDDVEPPQVPQ